jgi:2,5-furandicarboxylate decarboxylase 1
MAHPDLHSFLAAHPAAIWSLAEPVSLQHDLTALQHALDVAGRYPIVVATQVKTLAGAASPIPVVTNLTASRELTAAALGIPDHRRTAEWFARRSHAGIPPQVVTQAEAPVQQLIFEGDAASLHDLPVLTQHEREPGPYLTAAHATTFDPDTGIDNTAIQRCWVQADRRMTYFPYPSTHNARNLRKFHARGEPCPIAFWLGHHPAVLLGTQAKLKYPESHWEAAGGVIGQALRVVPSILHGSRVMVPADAEIVLEGFVYPGQTTTDGPFGEYTGYLGGAVQAPIVDIRCITRRRDALYHDYGSGLTDMLVPDNMAMEGKLFELVRGVAPSLINVHVPNEGRRFHAYLQFKDPIRGEVRDALAAALAYRRVKTVIAVDEDVDIFDRGSMLWALATRVRWERDAIRIDGLSGSALDPSLPEGESTVSKLGIDATIPAPAKPGGAKDYPAVATVPEAHARRAKELLSGAESSTWPQA